MDKRGGIPWVFAIAAIAMGCGAGDGTSAGAGAGAGASASAGALTFPQAIDGAFWANPDVYKSIPVRVAVSGGKPDAVKVAIGSSSVDATSIADGMWLANVPIDAIAEGVVDVTATATVAGGAPATASAKLGIGRSGVELTSFAEVGFAGVPRVHRIGDAMWITWTDRSSGSAEAYLRRIDGAGRWMTDRIPLVKAGEETIYARTAVGRGTLGILYQGHGSPYKTRFKIADMNGNEKLAPIALDPDGWGGSVGGDIAYDGAGFVCVWRVNDGAGKSELRWVRVDEASGKVAGPVVLAQSPASDADGGFDPITTIAVRAIGDTSVVTYTRKHYLDVLQTAIPKAQFTTVKRDGTIAASGYLGDGSSDFTWHDEAKVFRVGDALVPLWTSKDLDDPDPNPPVTVFGVKAPTDASKSTVVKDLDQRDEVFLLAHPESFGVVLWCDQRSYHDDPSHGKIQLFGAPVDAKLASHDAVTFPHARIFDGTSEVNGAAAGTNVVVLWLDERHGTSILDPKPEMWFDTMWL